MKIQNINFTKTNGQFGRKRTLPTFIIEEFKTDSGVTKFKVIDERNPQQGSMGFFFSIEEAVRVFRPYADQRTLLHN
jgi:hypothetical protein